MEEPMSSLRRHVYLAETGKPPEAGTPVRRAPILVTPHFVQNLIAECCAKHNIIPGMLKDSHEARAMDAKRMAVKRLADLGYSSVTIGKFLGGVHHTSVLHLLGKTGRSKGLKKPRGVYPKTREPIPCPDLSGEWAI